MPSTPQSEEYIEEVETEEVVNFAEIMPMTTPEYTDHQLDSTNSSEVLKEKVSQVYLKMNCSRNYKITRSF
jgi:alpha-acetolactate decarboxylase